MPNSAWSGRVFAASERSAHRIVRSTAASTRSGAAVLGGQSSKHMAMSAPSASWTRIDSSGLRNTVRPSRWLLNRTPPSSITLWSASENTWKPPESVSIGRSQPMNAGSPPARAMTSAPGLSHRW
jgi:hypothetical protein